MEKVYKRLLNILKKGEKSLTTLRGLEKIYRKLTNTTNFINFMFLNKNLDEII